MSIPIIHHRDTMPDALRGAVAALGNFDGFHLGHQAVAGAAISKARAEDRPAIIATFDPHPVRHFVPDVPPFRLTTLEQRQRLFESAGADAMLIFDFGAELAATSAEDFIAELLVKAARYKDGSDRRRFHLRGEGARRQCTRFAAIASARAHGLDNIAVAPVGDDGGDVIISSSRVSETRLKAGDCTAATASLLTRAPLRWRASCSMATKMAGSSAFPTANIDMGQYLRPRYGVYADKGADLADGRILDGAANLGIRPSFDPPKELLEAYLFDFDDDLYGQAIEIEFHAFIRDEAKFDDMEALKAQMAKDCDKARRLLEA